MSYINNPQIRRSHENAKTKGLGSGPSHGAQHPDHSDTSESKGEGKHPHSIHIHHAGSGAPHAGNPHHVHVHHADGSHEHSEHGSFDEALSHAQSKASEAGAPLGEESGAPVDGGEIEDGY